MEVNLINMDIYFILADPAVPENIGASARAIKTMGFNCLRLVRPKNYPNEKAEWLAHGSADILQATAIFNKLEDAITDLDYVIGTSSKERSVKYDSYPISELKSIIEKKGEFIQKLGIVFGGEESGLSNSDLSLCDMVSYVPLAQPYPSLNLSQAVMTFAFELSQVLERKSKFPKHDSSLLTDNEVRSFRLAKEKIKQILVKIDIPEGSPIHNRILERISIMGHTDLNLLHSVSSKLLSKIQ